ncbi:MAG TPA: glycosyltransferase family 1 protein [Patescibacteria group bacterium]|nr:glycosyltransferase family 1 protein [Patescibacteria group bacterium]
MNTNNKKRIGIDARFYGPVGKGLGRYTKEIVDNILRMDSEHFYVIFLSPENYDLFSSENKNVKKVLVKSRWYSWAEQIIFPWQIHKENLDLIHFTHFNVPILNNVKFVVTIHDLILTRFSTQRATLLPPLYYRIKYLAYRFVISRAIHKSEKIIAVSQFTKKDIEKKFKVKKDKINVIYEGVSDLSIYNNEDNDSDKKVLKSYNIGDRRYLLYVGNAYPHKNLEGLLDVFKKIKKDFSSLLLVLVGKDDYFYQRLKKYIQNLNLSNEDVIFTDYVSDKDLASLYRNSLAYVFPSLYEGFGLPPLEAMAYNCPVVSSNQTSLPEILGDAALYFDPDSNIDVYEKIKKIIKNKHLRRELAEKGKIQINQYNWFSSAYSTYKLYLEILK